MQQENLDKFIRDKCLCCSCGGSMKSSEHINLVCLDKLATWEFPCNGNVLSGQKANRATAVMCDSCFNMKALPQWAVEFKGDEFLYHNVDNLEDAPPLFPRPDVNVYGDLVCPKCHANIITPSGATVVPGLGHCPFCRSAFEVTGELALSANEIATNFAALSRAESKKRQARG